MSSAADVQEPSSQTLNELSKIDQLALFPCRRPTIIFFRDEDGSAPFLDWFGRLPKKAKVQCRARLGLLADQGHQLRGRLRTTSVTGSTS